jgi:hypothetical protein
MPSWLRIILFLGLGLLLGAGLGLYVGWIAWPTEYTEADLSILASEYRYDYTVMVAANYSLDGDLAAARGRLQTLAGEERDAWLLEVAGQAILQGAAEQDIRNLALLARDLGLSAPALEPYLPGNDG